MSVFQRRDFSLCDGTTVSLPTGEVLGRYCGSQRGPSVTSSANSVYITVVTDQQRTSNRGFVLRYRASVDGQCPVVHRMFVVSEHTVSVSRLHILLMHTPENWKQAGMHRY